MIGAPVIEQAKAEANGHSRLAWLKSGFSAAGRKSRETSAMVWLTSREMIRTPFRCAGRMAHDVASDVKRLYAQLAPALIVGLPLAICVTSAGLTVAVAPGALAARAVKSTNTVMGSVAMGAIGFLAGTALVVYVYELAVLWAVLEMLCLTARAAEKVQLERSVPACA